MQRLQRLALKRVEIEQKSRVLQFIRGVVGGLQNCQKDCKVGATSYGFSRFNDELVGIVLEPASPLRPLSPSIRISLHAVPKQTGEFENKPA